MKKVALSLDSSLKEIFTYEESRAVFDKFLPGMRTVSYTHLTLPTNSLV